MPAIGTPVAGVAAWLWVGVDRHAALVKTSGGAHNAAIALIAGLVAVLAIAGAVLSVAAAVMARRVTGDLDAAAARLKAEAEADAAYAWQVTGDVQARLASPFGHTSYGPGGPPARDGEEVTG